MNRKHMMIAAAVLVCVAVAFFWVNRAAADASSAVSDGGPTGG
jgi:hypothetical protein